MKRLFFYLFLGCLSVATIFSCKKDEEQNEICCEVEDSVVNLSINFNPILKGKELELNKEVDDLNGFPVAISLFKFYVSKLILVDKDDKEHFLREAAIIELSHENPLEDPVKNLSIKMVVPKGDYKGIRFGIGVHKDLNNEDPNVYEREHPLSVLNTMHWNWNSGYIFLKVEGDTDEANDGGELGERLSFHTGTNELYRKIDLSKEFSISEDKLKDIDVTVDLDKFFGSDDDQIDFGTDRITDATAVKPELAVRFADFYSKAFSLE